MPTNIRAVVAATPVTPSADARPAIQALQSLRSIVQAGTTYQNYSAKVGDAKAEVDRYLRATPEGVQRESIDMAMRYYVVASTAWSMKISHGGDNIARLAPALGEDARLSECSIVRQIREDKTLRDVALVALNIPPFWSCAFAKTAEAEKLLGK